jgi:signal peptidase I
MASQPTTTKKKSALREWANAAGFAIIAATLIRTFTIEAYAIPTGSMEGTMLINDYLFVNKLAYGPRMPMTPVAVPLMHNSIPFTHVKSYTDAVQWGYHRLPGFGKVQRDDIVVFNGPNGDTAIKEMPDMDYAQACRMYGHDAIHNQYTVITRPIDKKENLIKRCVAVAGDVLEIKQGIVYINGKPEANHPHAKMNYVVRTDGNAPAVDDELEFVHRASANTYIYNLANEELAGVKKAPHVTSVTLYEEYTAGVAPQQAGEWVFPFDNANSKWNRDNYGPVTVPKAGTTVALNEGNIALYRRIIRNYEGNTLEERDGKFFVNGKEASSYTFKMDYYWMMGDNRHNSLDSRYWGFVPDDHIVGKASFVWFSHDEGGLRWSRLFRSIKKLDM